MEELLKKILSKFDDMDLRFDKIESRLDKIESRLDNVESRLGSVESRLDSVESRLDGVESRLDNVESKINTMQDDITSLKQSAYLLENDIAPKVQVLLENHSDLAKNVLVAKGIEERVGTLEFDVKALKSVVSKLTA